MPSLRHYEAEIRDWVRERLDEQGSPTYFKSKYIAADLGYDPTSIGVALSIWNESDAPFELIQENKANGSKTRWKAIRRDE